MVNYKYLIKHTLNMFMLGILSDILLRSFSGDSKNCCANWKTKKL